MVVIDLIGITLRGYEIQEKLGEGGYGAVYRARELSVNRDVAIKVILPEHANEPEFIRRFEMEARLVAQLEDPHIVPLYSYWQDDQGAFLVMRYVRGGSLRERLRKQGMLSIAEITRILDQVAAALSVAHQEGVVHRDLKPDNILLDERGNAYLTDFGIARRLADDVRITQTDAIVGTFAYLAPEQIQNQPVSPQTDVYALGVMLYELLTGSHPFADTQPMMLLMKHLQEPLPSLETLREGLPSSCNVVIQRATAKSPDDRYITTYDVAEAFRAGTTRTGNSASYSSIQKPFVVSIPRKLPTTPDARNRYNMLQNVQKFWIEGVLNNSLYGATLLEPGMKHEPEHIDHAWDTLLRTSSGRDEIVPPDTRIIDIFDQLNGKLLILGDPGGGKTTMLLELARDLLNRATADDAHSIPVIFNLSSWSSNGKPLTVWLVDELSSKYQVPVKVAQHWVENDALLLLLDGLDEVAANQRDACVMAINIYREKHGFVDVVVCSRITDYDMLTTRLKLNGAIVIQPLNKVQIDEYLANLGSEMIIIRRLITEDSILSELSHSPLMLSIMALAYRGESEQDLSAFDTPEARRKHLFEVYVRRMFEHRVGAKLYSESQTTHYLSWLAQQMQKHTQSVFQIENLQPTWLTETQLKQFRKTSWMILLPYNFLFSGIPLLFAGDWLGVSGWLLGIPTGLVAVLLVWQYGTGNWRKSASLLYTSVLWGLAYGFSFGVNYDLRTGIAFFLLFTISFFSITRATTIILGGKSSSQDNIIIVEYLHFSWKQVKIWLGIAGFLFGVVATFGIYLLYNYFIRDSPSPSGNVYLALIINGIMFMISILFQSGLTAGTINLRTKPNQGIKQSLRNANRAALGIFINYFLFTILGYIQVSTLHFGLASGLSAGIFITSSFWLFYGGGTVIWHFVLRYTLYRDGVMPLNYAKFLDYATRLVFLRKVGGGYIFVHRYLLEYFADLEQPQPDAE